MSLRDRLDHARLEAARDAAARTAVLHQYAKAAQMNDERADFAEMFGLSIMEAEHKRAMLRCLRAWSSERDDPEPAS